MARARAVRGSILLETLLSIVLFAAAAVFTLAALRNALDATDRSGLRSRAADAARSAIAQLEAGVTTDSEFRRGRNARRRDGLLVEATVAPSAFPQLSLVEVKVRADDADDRVLFTLRQLVRVPDHRTSGVRP
ncbi:MAG: hypothetical protein SGJ11_17960 [Phycisphaerae bacterium]|nr:hypothetical protein [Phycisphaerae bacterium]